MSEQKGLIVSICIFIIVGMSALLLILNKGHIGEIGLVKVEEVEETLPTVEISIEKNKISSKDEEKVKITTTIDGIVVNEGVKYTSSDENVAKIEDNMILAVNDGKATITAEYEGQTATTDIKVITPIKTVTFTSTSSSIRVGKELQMKLQVKPSDADISSLKYSSSDESIATVNANGIVTGVSAGKVTITVEDEFTGIKKSVVLRIK